MNFQIFKSFAVEQWTKLPVPEAPLDGKTVIVTGSNTGLGLEAARHIVRLNAERLIIAVRSVDKGNKAKQNILNSFSEKKTTIIDVWELDQGNFASTRDFAEKVIKEVPRLDVAILNAGMGGVPWKVSPDGWESTLQVNDLSTAYLALLLFPKLSQAAGALDDLKPHLTIVASDAHEFTPFAERTAENILGHLNTESNFNCEDRYNVSKLINLYIATSIADFSAEQDGAKVVVNVLNPGFCYSELDRAFTGIRWFMVKVLKLIMARTTEVGSRTLVHAGTQCGAETNGKYLSSCKIKTPGVMVSGAEGPALKQKVWKEIGEVLTKEDSSLSKYFA